MKTLFLFENGGSALLFELDGDFSRFRDVFINGVDTGSPALQEELTALVFGSGGELVPELLEEPTKDWDFFVHCGFID